MIDWIAVAYTISNYSQLSEAEIVEHAEGVYSMSFKPGATKDDMLYLIALEEIRMQEEDSEIQDELKNWPML